MAVSQSIRNHRDACGTLYTGLRWREIIKDVPHHTVRNDYRTMTWYAVVSQALNAGMTPDLCLCLTLETWKQPGRDAHDDQHLENINHR